MYSLLVANVLVAILAILASPAAGLERSLSELWLSDDPSMTEADLNRSSIAVPSEHVKRLRKQSGQRINFIRAATEIPVSVVFSGGFDGILEQVVQGDSLYSRQTIAGREVIYADATKYDQIVTLPESLIVRIPRSDAFQQYVRWLNQHVAGFEALLPPTEVWGGPVEKLKAREERITLSRKGTVLEHLVQLLGADITLVFTVDPARSGLPQVNYHHIGWSHWR